MRGALVIEGHCYPGHDFPVSVIIRRLRIERRGFQPWVWDPTTLWVAVYSDDT